MARLASYQPREPVSTAIADPTNDFLPGEEPVISIAEPSSEAQHRRDVGVCPHEARSTAKRFAGDPAVECTARAEQTHGAPAASAASRSNHATAMAKTPRSSTKINA